MPLTWMLLVFFGTLLVMIGSGLIIALGLVGVGIIGFEFLGHVPEVISAVLYNATSSYIMAAVPLFLFMGEIVKHSGISERLYSGVSKWTSIIPGGLLHCNISSCALFAAISGSSVATATAIGSVAYPEQTRRGYKRGIVTGSLAAGSTLGILIPPSINMIVYGAFVGVSVGRLFIGGVVPGIILAGFFMILIGIRVLFNPALAELRQRITRGYFLNAITAFKEIWPVVVIMLTIFIGIYSGIFTPTEAAAVSCFEALIIAALFGQLNFTLLKQASLSSLQVSCMVMLIVVGGRIMGAALGWVRVPAQLCEMVGDMDISPLMTWLVFILLYLILGCLMDAISMMLVTLPITFPVLMNLGFDPIWFGVALIVLLECAMITPPVGINVYVIHGISGGTNIGEVFKGILPFFICMVLLIVLLTFVPELALWLPNMAFA